MKKSILFGVLAFFAISAMSVGNANAQDNTKKAKPQKQTITLQTAKQAAAENTVEPASENAPKTNDVKVTDEKKVPADKKAVKTDKNVKKPADNALKTDNKVKKTDGSAEKTVKKADAKVTTSKAQKANTTKADNK